MRVELEDAERRRGPVLDGAPRREVPQQAMPAHVARDQSLLVEEAQRRDGVRVAAEHELGLGRGAGCRPSWCAAIISLPRVDGGCERLYSCLRAKVSSKTVPRR